MTQKTVLNTGTEPIYLNLPGGRSLKIPARGQAEVDEADLGSGELALHLSRGNAVVIEQEGEEKEGGGRAETSGHTGPHEAGSGSSTHGES